MARNPHSQALLQLDRSLPHFPGQLWDVLSKGDFDEQISSLQTSGLMEVIDYLDEVSSPPTPAAIH